MTPNAQLSGDLTAAWVVVVDTFHAAVKLSAEAIGYALTQ